MRDVYEMKLFTFGENLDELKQNGVLQKAGESSSAVTIHEKQYAIRMKITLITTDLTLLFTSDFVRIDSIGTHLIENNIGLARQTSSDLRWDRIITTFWRTELRKKIAHENVFKLYNQGRVNDRGGGGKVQS